MTSAIASLESIIAPEHALLGVGVLRRHPPAVRLLALAVGRRRLGGPRRPRRCRPADSRQPPNSCSNDPDPTRSEDHPHRPVLCTGERSDRADTRRSPYRTGRPRRREARQASSTGCLWTTGCCRVEHAAGSVHRLLTRCGRCRRNLPPIPALTCGFGTFTGGAVEEILETLRSPCRHLGRSGWFVDNHARGAGTHSRTPSYAQAGREAEAMTGRRRPWDRRPSVTGPVAPADARHEIVRLAVPAFLALVAEPLFLLADAAIVGHLGTPQLAGLGIAAVGARHPGQPVHLPRLRHHRLGRPTGRRRRHGGRAGPGRGRALAGGTDRRGRDGRGAAGDAHRRRLVRPERRRRVATRRRTCASPCSAPRPCC